LNHLIEDESLLGFSVGRSQWPVAHFAFDGARIAPLAMADDALLQEFV